MLARALHNLEGVEDCFPEIDFRNLQHDLQLWTLYLSQGGPLPSPPRILVLQPPADRCAC